MIKTTLIKGIVQRLAVLLPSLCYALSVFSQTSIPERLNYVLEMQDMEMGIKLYNEISEADLAQLPDSSLFDYHYLGGYLNSSIFADDFERYDMLNHNKSISHLLCAKELCDIKLGTHSISYMEIMRGLGNEYLELKKYEEALGYFQEGIIKSMAIRGRTSEPFANLILGLQECYEYMGWYNEVPNHLMDAWEFWPKNNETFDTYNYWPLWNLRQFYRKCGNYNKALVVSDKIIDFITNNVGETHPNIAEELYFRGSVYENLGQQEDAVKTYQMGISVLRNNNLELSELCNMIEGNLTIILAKMGKDDEVENLLNNIKDFAINTDTPDIYHQALFAVASIYNDIGRYSKAKDVNTLLMRQQMSEERRTLAEWQQSSIDYTLQVINSIPTLIIELDSIPIESYKWFDAAHKLASAYNRLQDTIKSHEILQKMYDNLPQFGEVRDDFYYAIVSGLFSNYFIREDYIMALKYAQEQWACVVSESNFPDKNAYAVLNDLIVAKIKSLQLDEIDDDLAKAEELCKKSYGELSKQYGIFLHNKARALQLNKRLAESKSIYLESIHVQKETSITPMVKTLQYLMELDSQLIDEGLDL